MTKKRIIGHQNKLPWRYPADLKFFKEQTTGHTVIMGRKTCDSLPNPLPNRRNIVLTRDVSYTREGFDVFHTVEDILADTQQERTFVIGGAQIYWEFMPWITEAYITCIPSEHIGDAYMPLLPSNMSESRELVLTEEPRLVVKHYKTDPVYPHWG